MPGVEPGSKTIFSSPLPFRGLQQSSIYYNRTMRKHNHFGINNSVVRGSGIPNYSSAIRSNQHEYLFTQTFA